MIPRGSLESGVVLVIHSTTSTKSSCEVDADLKAHMRSKPLSSPPADRNAQSGIGLGHRNMLLKPSIVNVTHEGGPE